MVLIIKAKMLNLSTTQKVEALGKGLIHHTKSRLFYFNLDYNQMNGSLLNFIVLDGSQVAKVS